jgi:hypothetical protein
VGLASGIIAALTSSVLDGIVFGTLAGVAGGLAGGLGGTPADLAPAGNPNAVLTRDRRTFQMVGLVTFVAAGLVAKLMTGLAPGMSRGVINWVVAIGIGLGTALVAASIQAAWGAFAITRCWLALRHRLPWRLMGFLADAHERGVLRQVGPYYQFRHPELRHHLAPRWP